MPQPIIAFPKLNPCRMYEIVVGKPYIQQMPSFYYDIKPVQKWDTINDVFAFQIWVERTKNRTITNTVNFYNEDGDELDIFTPTAITTLFPWNGTYYNIYEYRTNFTFGGLKIPKGVYRVHANVKITVTIGGATVSDSNYYSEPMLCASSSLYPHLFTNTINLTYRHDSNNKGMVFIDPSTPTNIYTYYLRIDGGFKPEEQDHANTSVDYIDQENDTEILESTPYEIHKLYIGDGEGIPVYLMEIMNQIFSVDYMLIQRLTNDYWDYGKQYVRKTGAKIEIISEEYYPLQGGSIDLVEKTTNYLNEIDYLTW